MLKSTGPWLMVTGAVGAVAAGGAALTFVMSPGVEPSPPLSVGVAQPQAAPRGQVPAADKLAAQQAARITPEPQPKPNPEPVPEPKLAAETAATPVFDVVRVDPEGGALIAGTSLPGDTVAVLLDGVEVTRVDGLADGSFVALLDVAPAKVPRVLTLRAVGPAQTTKPARASKQSVIVAPAALPVPKSLPASLPANLPADEPPVAALGDPVLPSAGGSGSQAAAQLAPVSQPSEPALQAAQQPDRPARASAAFAPESAPVQAASGQDIESRKANPGAAAPVVAPQSTTPAVLLADDDGVRVLQPAASKAAPVKGVVIDAIAYDDAGDVVLTGRGTETSAERPARVRIYLNNSPVQTAPVSTDGRWSTPLPDVSEGVYTLRVDQIDAEGRVGSRFETPFKREALDVVARALAADGQAEALAVSVITVQPGYTLWGIASDRYGDGLKYVQVFSANQDLIKDPDLIYPGQVFELPQD